MTCFAVTSHITFLSLTIPPHGTLIRQISNWSNLTNEIPLSLAVLALISKCLSTVSHSSFRLLISSFHSFNDCFCIKFNLLQNKKRWGLNTNLLCDWSFQGDGTELWMLLTSWGIRDGLGTTGMMRILILYGRQAHFHINNSSSTLLLFPVTLQRSWAR